MSNDEVQLTKTNLVIYHSYGDKPCMDGFTAAWVARAYLPKDDTDYMPAKYGDDPPDVQGRNVYILDFSYPRAVLLGMKEQAASLVVLDHHKTAKEDLEGLDFCVFDMEESGAMLTWRYFERGELRGYPKFAPQLVHYVQDRDLWAWKLPHSREVNAYIHTLEPTFGNWDALGKELFLSLPEVANRGAVALSMKERYVEDMKANAYLVSFCGYRVPMVNTTYAHSELIGELARGYPFAIGWHKTRTGYKYSLRVREGNVDVSELARRMEYNGERGGGHARAAGFTLGHLLT